jgi:hypothetical protein
MTDIEKNLAIASMESALDYVHRQAGIESLAAVERYVRQIRQGFQKDPDSVTEAALIVAVTLIESVELPSLKDLRRIFDPLRPSPITITGETIEDDTNTPASEDQLVQYDTRLIFSEQVQF